MCSLKSIMSRCTCLHRRLELRALALQSHDRRLLSRHASSHRAGSVFKSNRMLTVLSHQAPLPRKVDRQAECACAHTQTSGDVLYRTTFIGLEPIWVRTFACHIDSCHTVHAHACCVPSHACAPDCCAAAPDCQNLALRLLLLLLLLLLLPTVERVASAYARARV